MILSTGTDNMGNKPFVGWQEWVSLPDLKLDAIKAKVDTGAKTCALHAYYVEHYTEGSEEWVRFGIHPNQHDLDTTVECHARLADKRKITDSGGHIEERFVISTPVFLNNRMFETQITLTNRDTMQFRMLLGRNLLNKNFVVDPEKSFLLGNKPESIINATESTDNEDCHPIKK